MPLPDPTADQARAAGDVDGFRVGQRRLYGGVVSEHAGLLPAVTCKFLGDVSP
jgi:hypothetical protein